MDIFVTLVSLTAATRPLFVCLLQERHFHYLLGGLNYHFVSNTVFMNFVFDTGATGGVSTARVLVQSESGRLIKLTG